MREEMTMKLPNLQLILLAIALHLGTVSCINTKEFWRYVVEDDVDKELPKRQQGTPDDPRPLSPHNVRVVYNDGGTTTEVFIPVLTSGQQIIIDHKATASTQSLKVVPMPPTDADQALEDAYIKSGQPVNKSATAVSLLTTHERIRELAKVGNYELALQYCDQILARYPNHPKTLRTKGSLLLKIGEQEAALKAYYKAQEVEPDPRVDDQIKAIERSTGGNQ